jgi:hypothetical protein
VPKPDISERNRGPETTLEKALIRACIKARRKDWSNQVPLISGVAGPWAYKKRAVDLVHQLSDGGFEFVELKVTTSDTPLHAAIEVVLYGLLWLLSRRDRELLGYGSNPILDAPLLQLSVLAPAKFYSDLALPHLPRALDAGLSVLGSRHGVKIGFRQTMFADGFQWPSPYDDGELLRFLDGRKVL